jgi:outer membrane lipoprotein-sorting protein
MMLLALISALACSQALAVSSADILARVKAAEAGVRDMKAEMVIASADKSNVSDMGEGYSDILRLQKAVISYKKPDKFRMDGFARGIKASFVQNGYKKLILAAMIRQTEDVKNKPGKRFDTLDFGFLSSRLWVDNTVTVISSGKNGVVELKLDPKAGGADKRHDNIWVDSKTLRVTKREKYRGNGQMRVRYVYTDFENLAGKLPIATTSTMYNPSGEKLGTLTYKNVQANVGLADSLFSLTQR